MKIYGTGVLFSGTASLVISRSELAILDKHYQNVVQNIQKLHRNTPRCVTFLLAGCLPGEAILHLKQMALFRMICYLPGNPLHTYASKFLSTALPNGKSWFSQIVQICLKYSLQHPHQLLINPPTKAIFKNYVKKAIVQYWEIVLRDEASVLDSLKFFHPINYSLERTHPIWTSVGNNPYECHKAVVLARMVSGRYRSEKLMRHWSKSNLHGYCLFKTCTGAVGSLEHILISCKALQEIRKKMISLYITKTSLLIPLQWFTISVFKSSPEVQLQFILDPLAFNEVKGLANTYGPTVCSILSYCSRTFAYCLHKEKTKLMEEQCLS